MIPSIALWIASFGALAGAIVDMRTGRVPNSLTYSLCAAGVLLAATAPDSVRLGVLVAVAGVGPLVLLLFARGLLGGGDAKLLMALAALQGYPLIAYTIFYSFLIGGVIAAIALGRRGRLLPMFSTLFRRRTIEPAADGPALPFAVFVCVGNLVALAALRV